MGRPTNKAICQKLQQDLRLTRQMLLGVALSPEFTSVVESLKKQISYWEAEYARRNNGSCANVGRRLGRVRTKAKGVV